MKFCIIKHLKNDIHSPVANYIFSERDSEIDSETAHMGSIINDFTEADRKFIFDKSKTRVKPLFCFGSYSITLIYPDNIAWTSQELNLGASHGGEVEVAGDISISSYGYTLVDWETGEEKNDDIDSAKNVDCAYTLIDSDADGNDGNAKDGYLSDKPYLAHIAVVIRPEYFQENPDWRIDTEIASEPNGDSQYEVNRDKIYDDLNNSVKNFLSNRPDVRHKVFGSLHTADYVVVVRAEKPETIFQISSYISETNHYTTNSILSMDIGIMDDATKFLRPKLRNMEHVSFALRFSATTDFLPEMGKLCNLKLQNGEGARLGFHDISIQLSKREFACLYPALCNNRIFKDSKPFDWEDNKNSFISKASEYAEPGCPVCGLDACEKCRANMLGQEISKAQGIEKGSRIWSINITLLCEATCLPSVTSTVSNSRLDRALKTREVTMDYIRRVTKLRNEQIYISKSRQLYVSSVNILLDLVKVYIPMSEQADLNLTGAIICEYIGYLLDGIERAVKQIKQLEKEAINNAADNKEFEGLTPEGCRMRSLVLSERVVDIIRIGVDAINTFSRLTMGVNLQFLNAANYELLSKTSAHKLLSAYYEFARELSIRFAEDYTQEDFDNNKKAECRDDFMFSDRRICVLPIPRLATKSPEAAMLHPHGFLKREDNDYRKHPYYAAVVRFPNIDTFLRVYTIVPYLRHEYAHFLRNRQKGTSSNEERNMFLLDLALSEVSKKIVFYIAEYSNAEYATILGEHCEAESLYRSLVNEIASLLKKSYFAANEQDKNRKGRFNYRLFSELQASLISFLKTLLARTTPNESENITRKKGVDQFFEFIDLYYEGEKYTKEILEDMMRFAYEITYNKMVQFLHDQPTNKLNGLVKIPGEILKQLSDAISATAASISELEEKRKKADMSAEDYASLMSLLQLKEIQDSRKETFLSEWSVAERLLYSSLRKSPYIKSNSGSTATADAGNRDFVSQFDSKIVAAVTKALDTCIRTLTTADNADPDNSAPIVLLREFTRMQLWISQKGEQTPKFWMLPEEIIENCVMDAFTIYNEMRSDIFMGTTLRFTPIGYAYLSVQNISRNINPIPDALFYRRHQYTMFALCEDMVDEFGNVICEITGIKTVHMMYQRYSSEYKNLMDKRTDSIRRRFEKLIENYLAKYSKHIPISYFDIENDSEAESLLVGNSSIEACDSKDKDSFLETIKQSLLETAKELKNDYDEMSSDKPTNEKMTFAEMMRHDFFSETNHTVMSILTEKPHLKPIKRIYDRVQKLRDRVDNVVSQGKVKIKYEALISYIERNLAYCIEQIAELYMLNSLLYRVYRLPACTVKEIEHFRTVAKIHRDKMEEKKDNNRSKTIDGIIEKISKYYNGEIIVEQREMIEDDMNFIFEFYWKNRARMASNLLANAKSVAKE